ncbi:hypothetical protein F4556_004527 [Kitasatospora gansuensis]|uniref:DUF4262 domain-containing protein n=1 Tax=Kitasatospora gansuensis TaxID=258050 RepID=A0A7W7SER8_9ACTN|nr:DUF4262 domain-containing protein [Kitasatospora gansuensis]MBB4948992.1 hypothetical protein [Kitasatospora gansuensis]
MHSDRPACRCVICHDYGDRHEAGRLDVRTVEQVHEHGWSVVMVPADDEGPAFAYTIGLWHSHGSPELAMFGLDVRTMQAMLNIIGHQVAAGASLAAGQERHDVAKGYPVVLKDADLRWYRTFFGRAIAFYRRPPFPVLEVVWPDGDGFFLWQSESDERYRQSQPQLWLTPAQHPAGVWTALADS